MKVPFTINIELEQILNSIETKEITPLIEKRIDKSEILEAFSAQELADYIIHNNLINEDLISLLISEKKLNLELILGKVAITHFQKTINTTISTDLNK